MPNGRQSSPSASDVRAPSASKGRLGSHDHPTCCACRARTSVRITAPATRKMASSVEGRDVDASSHAEARHDQDARPVEDLIGRPWRRGRGAAAQRRELTTTKDHSPARVSGGRGAERPPRRSRAGPPRPEDVARLRDRDRDQRRLPEQIVLGSADQRARGSRRRVARARRPSRARAPPGPARVFAITRPLAAATSSARATTVVSSSRPWSSAVPRRSSSARKPGAADRHVDESLRARAGRTCR